MEYTLQPWPGDLYERRNKIADIKTCRRVMRMGLKESLDIINDLYSGISVKIEATEEQHDALLRSGLISKGHVRFNIGDRAIVRLRPVRVTITKATPYWDEYRCRKCGSPISAGQPHGYSKDTRHFCIKCCEKA